MGHRRGKTRSAEREKARGRLGTPTSGQFSRWGPASRGSAKTRADYAALYRRECRTLSQSRMVRPLTASSSESVPCCDGVGRMATSSRTWPGKESRARCRPWPAVKAHFRALPYHEVAAALNSRWWSPGERRERRGARLTRRVREEPPPGELARVYFDRNATHERREATRFSRDGSLAERRVGFTTGCLAGMHRRSSPHRENWAAWVSPQAVKTVDGSKASKAAKLCLQFLILTAARSGEARGARLVVFLYTLALT